MSKSISLLTLALGGLLAMTSTAAAQNAAYIGYVYPAGGQQGTTFQIRLGGQRIDGVHDVIVSGEGVQGRIVKYYRRLSNQEMSLLKEQLRDLKREVAKKTRAKQKPTREETEMIARIEARTSEWVNRPANAALSALAFVEITIAPDAKPGRREIRLVTLRGVTNPLVFCVGQVPEVARKPMKISYFQVLGKEASALRKRPDDEIEQQITVPCTMNGQVASGEVNRYRFQAKKGQRLVVTTAARQLIPYIADAVPGWFQPVIKLEDANGKELAFNDDYRFKPDPTLFFDVPQDGEYLLSITDAIYRGREDFVYRMTISELPFVTSIFPLGGRAGQPFKAKLEGWNIQNAKLDLPDRKARPGVYQIAAKRNGLVSNTVPFAVDTLPEVFDQEPNNAQAKAQEVQLPVIVNGRIDRPDDWDVFCFNGKAGQKVVTEVMARRLDSPVDSFVKITDSNGDVLAFNDDHEAPGSGLNTHHADSYIMYELPSDGVYYVHMGETARKGGTAYGYRLRISQPRPDFELRVQPSSLAIRSRSGASLNVYAIRKDGFSGPISLQLDNPPKGFIMPKKVTLTSKVERARVTLKTTLADTNLKPVDVTVTGQSKIGDRVVKHDAVPAEDQMQAFLWRHLVPAQDLKLLVYRSSQALPLQRVRENSPTPIPTTPAKTTAVQAKFTKKQVAGRLRQLKLLYGEWLLTDAFYDAKVAECEASL